MRLAFSESILRFCCQEESLLGIVTEPDEPSRRADLGVIIVVGGPQYRAGSHRLFVRLARKLAESGITTLRFDYRGMGDSSGEYRNYLAITQDIQASIDALLETSPHLKHVVLWGLCDGASASLLYLNETQDSRVCGLVLLNPWVRSEATLATTHVKHYYSDRLRQPDFWKKLLTGKVAASAIIEVASKLRLMLKLRPNESVGALPFQQGMAQAWVNFPGRILLLLSEQDLVSKEFLDHARTNLHWKGALQHSQLKIHQLAGADHTCSSASAKDLTVQHTVAWINHAENYVFKKTHSGA